MVFGVTLGRRKQPHLFQSVIDLSLIHILKKLDVRGTGLTRVKLATGAPVVQLCLPDTIEELFLDCLLYTSTW